MAGTGKPMPNDVREKMESSFNADFSDVRVHTDASSGNLNQTVSTRAFTSGTDIFFASGQYQPGTQQGQQLLAHELTHVVQQRQGRVRPTKVVEAERNLSSRLAADGQKSAVN